MNTKPTQPHERAKKNIIIRKGIIVELAESLKREVGKYTEDAEEIRLQNDEYEKKAKYHYTEVLVMHRQFLDLREGYLRTKRMYEDRVFELQKEIERLGGARAERVEIEDEISRKPAIDIQDVCNSKEKKELIKTLSRRGRGYSEILVDGGSVPPPERSSRKVLNSLIEGSNKPEEIPRDVKDVKRQRQERSLEKTLSEKETRAERCKKMSWTPIYSLKDSEECSVALVDTIEYSGTVSCVRFSPCGKFLACATKSQISLHSIDTGETVVTFSHGEKEDESLFTREVCFSRDGKLLFGASEDKNVRLWTVKDGRQERVFRGHTGAVYTIQCCSSGESVYSGSLDQTVICWSIPSGKKRFELKDKTDTAGVGSVCLTKDGRFLAAGYLDHKIRIWGVGERAVLATLQGHINAISRVAFSPNEDLLVSSSFDKTLRRWSFSKKAPAASKCLSTSKDHADIVMSFALSSTQKWIVSGSRDKAVYISDIETGLVQIQLHGHKQTVFALDFHPKIPGMFVSSSADGIVALWNLLKKK
ncbi:MAG: transcriptional repressor Tup1 [Amphiamblys sp. WSBS2006]|nr:MAG: transcriptional repressor Tup1 [Amphiamblys sp. WSBS2006]